MKQVADVIHRFLQGNRLEPKEVLWGLLICAFLFASVHLVTMFLTRWGDHRVTGKALLFSLMLHFAFLVSVVAVPIPPGIPGGGAGDDAKGREDEHRVVIHSVSEKAGREARDGKLDGAKAAVWDRLPPVNTTKLMGPQPQEPTTAAPRNVDRIEERPQSADLKPPDLASLPETQQPPRTPASAEAAPIQRSAQTPEIETPKTASRPRPEPRRADVAPARGGRRSHRGSQCRATGLGTWATAHKS